ncbi:MAG: 16S rRNA (guanine(527)-N(7))-methyltransferase RsmG [Sulfobacillus sp.]
MTLHDPLADWLAELARRSGRTPDEGAARRLGLYVERLLAATTHGNLTALRDPQRLWTEGVGPSLALWPLLPSRGPLIDIGPGAGLPGLVLACLEPQRPWLFIESRHKPAAFLSEMVATLGLSAQVVHQRAEQVGRGPKRQQAAGATARAVGSLGLVAELALPLLRHGGVLVSPRGDHPAGNDVLEQGLIGVLGGELRLVEEPSLSGFVRRGQVALIEKRRPTPSAYPRTPPALGQGIRVVTGTPPAGGEQRLKAQRGG